MRYRGLLSLLLIACLCAVSGCIEETDPETECDDGKDNDLDGLWDCDDPDCAGVAGCPGVEDDDDATGDDDDATGDDDTSEADDDATGDDDTSEADDDATGDDDTSEADDDATGDDDTTQ